MIRRKSLISLDDPKAPASEAYRMIRTNLEYTNVDSDNRIIAFTSSKTQEGKTTTICNVAVTMAHAGQKVLIVDLDLRKPRLHKLFKIPNDTGVTNLIVKNKGIEEAIQHIRDIPNVDLLTSGPIPPMPSELIASKRMKEILDELSQKYDVILIDTPPVLSVTDATIVSRYTNGVILTVAVGEASIEEVKTSKKALDKVEANILGVILTKADYSKNGYYYYYHYDYNYNNESNKKRKKTG